MFELSQNKIKFELTKRELRKLNTLKNKVVKLNNDLREYFDTCGEMSLPDIECTCIGYSPMGMIKTNDIKDKEGNKNSKRKECERKQDKWQRKQ